MLLIEVPIIEDLSDEFVSLLLFLTQTLKVEKCKVFSVPNKWPVWCLLSLLLMLWWDVWVFGNSPLLESFSWAKSFYSHKGLIATVLSFRKSVAPHSKFFFQKSLCGLKILALEYCKIFSNFANRNKLSVALHGIFQIPCFKLLYSKSSQFTIFANSRFHIYVFLENPKFLDLKKFPLNLRYFLQ